MDDVAKTSHVVRQHTISWEDPSAGVNAGREMSGVEYLRAMFEGRLPMPPISSIMNMRGVEVDEGRVVFAAEPAEYHYNPIGTVHGGFASTLLDSAMACSVHSMLPVGTGYTTLELKVNLVRPLTLQTGTVYCEGKVLHAGGRVATAEGRLTDANGKLYAHGTTTCMIIRQEHS